MFPVTATQLSFFHNRRSFRYDRRKRKKKANRDPGSTEEHKEVFNRRSQRGEAATTRDALLAYQRSTTIQTRKWVNEGL
jgi:hypothetical protein